jgi:hypothetical protein
MELRLVQYLDKQLHEKANKVEIVAMATSLQDKANARDFNELRVAVTEHERNLKSLQDQVKIQDKVNEALRARAKEVQETSASNFTRGEKLIATALGVAALAIQVLAITGGIG